LAELPAQSKDLATSHNATVALMIRLPTFMFTSLSIAK
jgi:hypothetical protein